MLILIIMNIRNRISQFLKQIYCTKGGILLGRVSGAGPSQEITIGSGLQLTGTTLSVTGGGGTWGSITGTLGDQTDLASALSGKLTQSQLLALLAQGGDGLGVSSISINSAGGTCGILNLWSDSGFKAQLFAPIAYTGDRAIELPDAEGTLALGMKWLDARTTAVVVGPNDNGVSFQLSSTVGTLTLPDPTPGMRFWAFVTAGVVNLAGAAVTDFRRSVTITNLTRNDGIVEFEACGWDFWKFIPEIPRANVRLVSTLPSPYEVGAGFRSFVTDSNQAATNVGSTSFSGGGANFCPVYSNGAQWVIG